MIRTVLVVEVGDHGFGLGVRIGTGHGRRRGQLDVNRREAGFRRRRGRGLVAPDNLGPHQRSVRAPDGEEPLVTVLSGEFQGRRRTLCTGIKVGYLGTRRLPPPSDRQLPLF